MFAHLSNVSRRAVASQARLHATSLAKRSIVTLQNTKVHFCTVPSLAAHVYIIQYTATARAAGQGRSGQVHSDDEVPLTLTLALPKALGGPGDGTNPEQLFALGYACTSLLSPDLWPLTWR